MKEAGPEPDDAGRVSHEDDNFRDMAFGVGAVSCELGRVLTGGSSAMLEILMSGASALVLEEVENLALQVVFGRCVLQAAAKHYSCESRKIRGMTLQNLIFELLLAATGYPPAN